MAGNEAPTDRAVSGTIGIVVVSSERVFSMLFAGSPYAVVTPTIADLPPTLEGVRLVVLGPDLESPAGERRLAIERWGAVPVIMPQTPDSVPRTAPDSVQPRLSAADNAALGAFYRFYEQRRIEVLGGVRVRAAAEPELAEAASIIEATSAAALSRFAVSANAWEPYLEHLRTRAEAITSAGVSFATWLEYTQLFRRVVADLAVAEVAGEALAQVLLGVAVYADLSTLAIGEAGRRLQERQGGDLSQYSAIFAASADAVLTTRLDGTVVTWNPAAERVFGYSAEEVIGSSILRIVPRDRRAEAARVSAMITRGRRVPSFDTTRLRKNGSPVEVAISVAPVRNADGTVEMAAIIARDITDRKRAEERFRLAVEAMPNATVMINASGQIELVNAMTEQLFGYERSELIGQPVEILVPQRFRDAHPGHRGEFFHEPDTRPMGVGRELFGVDKAGQEFPIEVGLNPLDIAGKPLVLAAIVDISARRRAEAEVQRTTDELVRSNAELEQFAYVASHDLQEPLRMVASYTGLLTQALEGRLDDRELKYVGYILDGATRMQQLITDLLAYSRIGTRGNPFEPTDSTAIVQQVLRLMHLTIRDTGTTVTLGDLPIVACDASQVSQVFQNLFGNAIKFRREASPHIAIAAERRGSTYIFSVSDNGIGIEREYAERIFQMFQRLHERGRYEGSGIGLAITKRIVERHGGKIWFESTPGEGTTFYFSMPAGAR